MKTKRNELPKYLRFTLLLLFLLMTGSDHALWAQNLDFYTLFRANYNLSSFRGRYHIATVSSRGRGTYITGSRIGQRFNGGLGAGMGIGVAYKRSYRLQLEALYDNQGTVETGTAPEINVSDYSLDLTLGYLRVPLLFQYALSNIRPGLRAEAGTYVGFLLLRKGYHVSTGNYGTRNVALNEDDLTYYDGQANARASLFSGQDIGLIIGATYDLPLAFHFVAGGEKKYFDLPLALQVRYQTGFLRVVEDSSLKSQHYNHGVQFSLLYHLF